MSEESPNLVMDGKEYPINDMSDRSKYILGQLQDLEQQARATKAKLDQIEVARAGFTELLKKELTPSEE